MQFGNHDAPTVKQIAAVWRHNAATSGDNEGLMLPVRGLRMVLDELFRLWDMEAAITKTPTEVLPATPAPAKRGPGRPKGDA